MMSPSELLYSQIAQAFEDLDLLLSDDAEDRIEELIQFVMEDPRNQGEEL
jgi:Mn-dependent DtxR family transcriptional regulator